VQMGGDDHVRVLSDKNKRRSVDRGAGVQEHEGGYLETGPVREAVVRSP